MKYLFLILAMSSAISFFAAEALANVAESQGVTGAATDTKITAAVKTKLLSAKVADTLAPHDITVATDQKIVTLTGCVRTQADKSTVEDIVLKTADVANVVDDSLVVDPNCKK